MSTYGTLALQPTPQHHGRRNNALMFLGLIMMAATAGVFYITGASAPNVPQNVVNFDGQYLGDTLADGVDCECDTVDTNGDSNVDALDELCVVPDGSLYGTCVTTQQEAGCIGIDYKETYLDTSSNTWKAACMTQFGKYDCYSFPCENNGFCIDGEDEFQCVCPFGYKGTTCGEEINECESKGEGAEPNLDYVCHKNASCQNTEGQYQCKCQDGFVGDGFATDQTAIRWGSVLSDSTEHGWLDRSVPAGTTFSDLVNNLTSGPGADNIPDRFGCTDINDCASNPCYNGGQCIDEWLEAAKPKSFRCDCTVTIPDERWEGEYCEINVDECSTGQHNCDGSDRAECTDNDGSFSCNCKQFWEGDGLRADTTPSEWGCTTANGCAENAGYAGCSDVKECNVVVELEVDNDNDGLNDTQLSSPCQNGAACREDGPGTGEYYCDCTTTTDLDPDSPGGWRGHDCEININECDVKSAAELGCDENAYCHDTQGSWECRCNNGWTGNGHVEGGCYDADDCEFSPCQHGGTCTDCGTLCYICDCVVGWRGKSCEVDWNECKMGIHTCHDMAICINTPGSFECDCEPGYSGDGYRMCNEVNDCNRWEDDDAIDDSILTDYAIKTYGTVNGVTTITSQEEAVWPAPWADDRAITVDRFEALGVTVDSTAGITAGAATIPVAGVDATTAMRAGQTVYLQDGTTVGTLSTVATTMLTLTVGPALADGTELYSKRGVVVHQCGEWDPATQVFKEHGTCDDVGPAAYVCTCDAGWSDSNCDLNINECARSTDVCHKYADCIDTAGSYKCECKVGYTGDGMAACNDIDDCTVGNERCEYGYCTDLGVGDFRCTCAEGWMDRLCDEDIDECSSFAHNCGTNAICINTAGSYRCECPDGWAGDGLGKDTPDACIDMDDCGTAPCENGECVDNGTFSYICNCDEGWEDTNCDFDVNECYNNTHDCHPDGKCVNTPGGFFCRCVSGFAGDGYTCTDLDDCDPDPCDPEHGSCYDNGQNKYTCACDEGFCGAGCEQNCPECLLGTDECDANASCFDNYGSYTCVCNDEFYGDGLDCAPCTDCKADCVEEDPNNCTTGAGFTRDVKSPACNAVDRTCRNIDECNDLVDNCDGHADCSDTHGSFTCTCHIHEEWWGTGVVDECYRCTRCRPGEFMLADCTATTDRICKPIIPDGNYAIETFSQGIQQCLVHWKEAGKIYPERYAWGGGANSSTDTSSLATMTGSRPGADYCDNPMCGLCAHDGSDDVKRQLVLGMEAVWIFKNIEDDLYLILNAADGHGFRCLGFKDRCDGAPERVGCEAQYPSLITYESSMQPAAEGLCIDSSLTQLSWTADACIVGSVDVTNSVTVQVASGGGGAGYTEGLINFVDVNKKCDTMPRGTYQVDNLGTITGVSITNTGNCSELPLAEPIAGGSAGAFTVTFARNTSALCQGTVDVSGVVQTAGTWTAGFCSDAAFTTEATCTLDDKWTRCGNTADCTSSVTIGGQTTTAANTSCEKENVEVGQWSELGEGVSLEVLNAKPYYCGMEDSTAGGALEKLMASPATVWNIKALGCKGSFCENRTYANKFLIRSLSRGDQNMDGVIDYLDYDCIYFPAMFAGDMYSHPRRIPTHPSPDGVWLGRQAADVDGNGDTECGIVPGEGQSQEVTLVNNKQAVFNIIPLPNF